ncbi:MAG: GntR family transcriptional regulator [Rubrivivax sp.]|nr:GntR family transcriptional regulator [Rubrivivax sp.]
MNAPLRLERPQLLTDVVCARIRTAIVDGEFALGEQMSEAQLAQRLGVSKTPVREALLRLKADGLVEIHPQRGSFVFRLDADRVGQLCRYRAMIETAALREALAVGRGPALARTLAALVTAMKKGERTRDLKALATLDMDFHWQLFAHCPNRYLLAGYDVVRWQLVAMRQRAPIDNAVDSHQVLVDAIGDGDVERACTLLVGHVLENESRYADAMRAAAG